MEIQHKDDGKKGKFFIEAEGKTLAELAYVWAGTDKVIIEHTEVDESLKGKNIGKILVEHAVSFARQKQIKILPLCPFAKSVFDKSPQYNDVAF